MINPEPPLRNSEAFSRLFDRTHLAVYRYIFVLIGGPGSLAEDLTADTYLRAWKSRHRFQGNDHAAIGWLFTIARNLVIDASRRRKVRGFELDYSDPEDWLDRWLVSPEGNPEIQVLRQEQFKILWDLIQGLPLDRRELIILRYMLDWPVKNIADHLNMLENTVSVYLRRTLDQLHQAWPGGDQNHDRS